MKLNQDNLKTINDIKRRRLFCLKLFAFIFTVVTWIIAVILLIYELQVSRDQQHYEKEIQIFIATENYIIASEYLI